VLFRSPQNPKTPKSDDDNDMRNNIIELNI